MKWIYYVPAEEAYASKSSFSLNKEPPPVIAFF